MIKVRSITVFLISFVAVFLMVLIPHIKPKPSGLLTPSPEKIDLLEKVKPKLEQRPLHYQLKKEFIPVVSAGSDYEEAVAYGVIDFDNGTVLTSKNLSQRLPIASLTKLMTAVVALDLAKPEDVFTVSEKAARQPPTKVMLKAGESFTLQDLLKFLMITSANDSAEVVKEGIDGRFGQGVFIQAMNYKAKLLGLSNTRFSNPQGFDSTQNFSSVEDLSLLSYYVWKNYPLIAQIAEREYEDLTGGNQDLRFYLNNWNGLLGTYPGAKGIKIGNTDDAGICTIVLAERQGKEVLVVLLGAPGITQRDLWASELLDLGFKKLVGLSPVNITESQLKDKYASWKYF